MEGTHVDRDAPVADAAGREAVATDVVRRITQIAGAMRHVMDNHLAALGLTPAAARALDALDPDRPMPARHLADMLGCDRSNVTILVDRLEDAGLVERRADPADRRLRTLMVTDAGRRVRTEVRRVMTDSRLLAALTDGELASLRGLLRKISAAGQPVDRVMDTNLS